MEWGSGNAYNDHNAGENETNNGDGSDRDIKRDGHRYSGTDKIDDDDDKAGEEDGNDNNDVCGGAIYDGGHEDDKNEEWKCFEHWKKGSPTSSRCKPKNVEANEKAQKALKGQMAFKTTRLSEQAKEQWSNHSYLVCRASRHLGNWWKSSMKMVEAHTHLYEGSGEKDNFP